MKISVMTGGKDKFETTMVDDITDIILSQNYSLSTFSDAHRTKDNFISAELIGLDFDGGLTINDAVNIFKDYWHIIGTTRSHQKPKNGEPACDRFRVILKPEKIIDNNGDYKATILQLLDKYPQADKACKDSSRMFYPCTTIYSVNETGSTIPVYKYEEPKKEEIPEIDNAIRGELAKSTLDFIAFGANVNWNSKLFKAAIDLHEQQYTKTEALELLTLATRRFDGELDEADLRTIDSAYSKDPDHAPRGTESMFNFKRAGDMSESGDKIDWLVEGLLGFGAISLLVGAPKCGKSTLTRQLAISASRGEPWLDRKVKKTTVLYLALEEQESMFKLQMKHIGMKDNDDIFVHCGKPFPGDIKENLTGAINMFKAGFVIVDTMLLLTSFTDINNYNEAYAQLNVFREIARDTGVHILMVHHANKMGEGMNKIMGSTGLLGAVDCGIVIDMVRGDSKRRRIISQGRGGVPFQDTYLEYIKEKDIYVRKVNQNRPEGI